MNIKHTEFFAQCLPHGKPEETLAPCPHSQECSGLVQIGGSRGTAEGDPPALVSTFCPYTQVNSLVFALSDKPLGPGANDFELRRAEKSFSVCRASPGLFLRAFPEFPKG